MYQLGVKVWGREGPPLEGFNSETQIFQTGGWALFVVVVMLSAWGFAHLLYVCTNG